MGGETNCADPMRCDEPCSRNGVPSHSNVSGRSRGLRANLSPPEALPARSSSSIRRVEPDITILTIVYRLLIGSSVSHERRKQSLSCESRP